MKDDPMPSIIDQLTEIYVFIDDHLKQHPEKAQWRGSNNDEPAFSDAEVLTIGLSQSAWGVQSLKETYQKIRDNHREAFPHLPSYKQWLARLHALNHLVSDLLVASTALLSGQPKLYLIDSKPIPVCHPLRHGRVRLMREDGARFGKTKKGWFFGFKLHALRHVAGRVVNLILTPANIDDRVPTPDLLMATDGGIIIGDLGYRGKKFQDMLIEEFDMLMLTRADATDRKKLLSQIRQQVETTFSQLWMKFIDRVFSRSWLGLWNTLQLKVLFYNLCHAHVISM
jgi:transposase